ncbi:hypothetical protein WA026_013330 [Henosepilachna vigintioctopunctata]|uniref:Uncharacterized protein n=1 Tax=Henosepilachna vigintioctopunctata TaxID=420089 RepID=A0AAW1VDV0_9CUCU
MQRFNRGCDTEFASGAFLRCCGCIHLPETYTVSCRGLFALYGILPLFGLFLLELSTYVHLNRDKFLRNKNIHEKNRRARNDIRVSFQRLNIGRKSANCMDPRLYNHLPLDIREAKSTVCFKQKLRRYILTNMFYSLEEYLPSVS